MRAPKSAQTGESSFIVEEYLLDVTTGEMGIRARLAVVESTESTFSVSRSGCIPVVFCVRRVARAHLGMYARSSWISDSWLVYS